MFDAIMQWVLYAAFVLSASAALRMFYQAKKARDLLAKLGDMRGVGHSVEVAMCPCCGLVETRRNFDVAGADVGKVFCNRCYYEFAPEWLPLGELLPLDELV
jgi:hypothetical protein